MRIRIDTFVIISNNNNNKAMKKQLFLLVLVCTIMCKPILSQEFLRLSFTGQIGDGYYQKMESIGIKNVTRDWIEVIHYPDTTITIDLTTSIQNIESGNTISVAPNPFYGESNIFFEIKETSHVVITAHNLSGDLCTKHETDLFAGNYTFKMCLSKTQIYIISIQIGNVRHSLKVVNLENRSTDYIVLTGWDNGAKQPSGKGYIDRPFEFGDIMEYVGSATINGSAISSEHIIQSQLFNEDIILHFSAFLPTVQTDNVSNIAQTTATCGGEVTSDGYAFVSSRGVCWNTEPHPTLANSHTTDQNGIGHFNSSLTELSPNTTYYVRAYATNSVGTVYGNEISFTTEIESTWPNGTLPGLFSVDPIQKVQFSQGVLQYRATTNTWRFAETQYEFIGQENLNISSNYDGYIDLFGWGTSGYSHGAVCYQPWSITDVPNLYYAYGYMNYNLYDLTGKADWGYNAIINGGNQENYWRTLSSSEWQYLLFDRETPSGIRFAKVSIGEISQAGLILLPDDWDESIFYLIYPNEIDPFSLNALTLEQLNYLEANGAVFLLYAGLRHGDLVGQFYYYDNYCCYWTSDHSTSNSENALILSNSRSNLQLGGHRRCEGLPVRLARTTALNKRK